MVQPTDPYEKELDPDAKQMPVLLELTLHTH